MPAAALVTLKPGPRSTLQKVTQHGFLGNTGTSPAEQEHQEESKRETERQRGRKGDREMEQEREFVPSQHENVLQILTLKLFTY